jgi:hypothetical protein
LQEWGYKIYKGKKSRGSFLGVFETKSCIIFIIYRSILLPFSFSLDILSMPYRPWEDAAFAASFAATPRLPAVVSTPRFIRKAQSFLDSWMILLGSHGMWRDVTTSGWGYQVRSELFSWDHPMMFGCSGMFWDVLGCFAVLMKMWCRTTGLLNHLCLHLWHLLFGAQSTWKRPHPRRTLGATWSSQYQKGGGFQSFTIQFIQ